MDEQFETRTIIPPAALKPLLTRRTWPSVLRLGLHLLSFVGLAAALTLNATTFWVALPLAIALAWVWSSLFAPFHECTHRTAFRSPAGNRLGAWLTGVPFGMAPSVYRSFHFEHHRHTQDLARDPELLDPRYAQWPDSRLTWLIANSGYGLMMLKIRPLLGFAFKHRSRWAEFAPWSSQVTEPEQLVRECRILCACWASLLLVTALLPGGLWWWFAAWFTHVFQTLWVAAEHSGLPHDGSILRRTRTVQSNAFVRFWLWNMNFHAEHHGWPAIPWHMLPKTHALVATHLESNVHSYTALQSNIFHGRDLPTGDPRPAATG
ncbi:MAG: hypothetical protein RL434_1004 [Pseudomonadota bacterium]|jgi:fatty acid desaturase